MIKNLLSLLSLLFVVAYVEAQTTILDFEGAATSTTFQYFGSGLDGSLNQVVANPDPSGENTSSMVANFIKPAVAEVWAGCFSNPNPGTPVDLTINNKVAIKVWMDHLGSLSLKLENSTDGGSNWVISVPNTKVNAWETLVFDTSIPSVEGPNAPAAGYTYSTVTLFFDFGNAGTGTDVLNYFDDVAVLSPPPLATTILDFEAPGTSTGFQYFGSPLDGTLNQIVPNPDPSGENTSSMVSNFIKPAVAEVWAGAFSNPNPSIPVDLTVNNKVAIKVWMDHLGSLSLKLENSTDGGSNWVITVPNTKVNQWETLVFDPSIPSLESPNAPAIGYTYATVTLFFDFGNAGTGTEVLNFFDDIVTLAPPPVVTNVLDFEAPETSTGFQYFGSTLDGTLTAVVANPDASGINTSGNVTQFIKPAAALVWAGAFSNPNPTTPVTLEANSQVCIKVWMDHIGSLSLKLENSATGNANWITTVANNTINQWEELCFDISVPSLEAPFEPAAGTYQTITLFFDFGTAGTGTDVASYFDDIVVKSSGAPQAHTVHFKVDMNQYAGNFDKVYLSGSFNGWSGDANPLADPEFDGVWEGDIQALNGTYEYKVTLDNWSGQEQFAGLEECTKKDPSGQFVNRLLLVSGDTELPSFCYNSCYACGQEAQITFRLGMFVFTPNPEGVWLAGGGNFDSPGGKYKMQDDDGDGVYEITMPRALGFSSFYDFANGPCPDYSCKEDLSGQSCGDPNNYNDRFLSAISGDITLETCFGTCYTDVACTTGTVTPQSDARVFDLLGNPPVNGISQLIFGEQIPGEKYITLSNTLGQTIRHWHVEEGVTSQQMSTAGLSSGLYLVTVKTGNHFYTRKLMK